MPDAPTVVETRWPPLLRDRGPWWEYGFDAVFLVAGVVAGVLASLAGGWCSIPILVGCVALGLKGCFKFARKEKWDDALRASSDAATAANERADSAVQDANSRADRAAARADKASASADRRVALAHEAAEARADEAIAQAQAKNSALARWFLELIEDRIATPQALVLRAVATADSQHRRELAATARARLLTLAATDVLGSEGARVRVNLFELEDDVFRCTLSPAGRGEQKSTRTFDAGTETYVATMLGDARFIHDTYDELPDEAPNLKYRTFATAPIGSPDGRIWGVLTADAPDVGKLSKDFDIPLMQVYAGLIGITFACEQFSSAEVDSTGTVSTKEAKP